jgi:hypothetical protein
MKVRSFLLAWSLFALCLPAASASAQVLTSESFNTFPYSVLSNYHDGNATGCGDIIHQPTGGWNGSPGARIIFMAGQTQCSQGFYGMRSETWGQQETLYVRFRIRYDDSFRWTNATGNKLLLVGGGFGSTMLRRVNVEVNTPYSSAPASPCINGVNDGTGVSQADLASGRVGSLSIKQNVSNTCTQGFPIYAGRWYHVQMAFRAGLSENSEFRLWMDNNSYAAPTRIKTGTAGSGFSMESTYWYSYELGYYLGNAQSVSAGYVIDDVQFARSFDPAWYPGGSSGTPTAPNPPTAVRIIVP